MQTQSPATERDAAPSIGGNELAEGLMLVRASTLKMIRLQLAMERRDRRVAMEEVDDLLALDRRLQEYLGAVPGDPDQTALDRELAAERAALNRERLTLAGEVIRREPQPVPELQDVEALQLEAPDLEAWGSFEFARAEQERQHRRLRWFVAALILLCALAAAAWLAGDHAILEPAARAMGAVQ